MDGNGGWQIGPFFVRVASKSGPAFLRWADPTLTDDPCREAVKFSLCDLDSLFLTFADASQIVSALELVGIEAQIGNVSE